jgi:hypothetical protein
MPAKRANESTKIEVGVFIEINLRYKYDVEARRMLNKKVERAFLEPECALVNG